MKTLRDFNFRDKRVLVRCDFNVPVDGRGSILDDFRIEKTLTTIMYLRKEGAGVVLMSHLGDPGGTIQENLRLEPIRERLESYLRVNVVKANDCIGKYIENQTYDTIPASVMLLENLRFHKEEEEGDSRFAEELSRMGDIYVNDAFGCCHRPHASIVGVPKYLPSAAGFLLEKEINILNQFLENPRRPVVVIVGGKKVQTKTKFLERTLEMADTLLVGGPIKREIEERRLVFNNSQKIIGPTDDIRDFDINGKTIETFKDKILGAGTVFWNGPLGKIEEEIYTTGSREIAQAIIDSGAFSIIGGGETVEFINKIGFSKKFSHVSTGGSAMLAYVAGEKLPGIEALR